MGLKRWADGIVASMATKIGISWALGQVRAAAEGRLGPEWKVRYWWLAGKKTITGVVFAMIAAVLAALGYEHAGEVLITLGATAVTAGLLDKAWRTEIPAWLKESVVYRFLAGHSAWLAPTFSSLFLFVQAGECGGLDCRVAGTLVAALAAIAVWAGLLDTAWKAAPPILQRRDGKWEINIPGDGQLGFALRISGATRSEVHDAWHALQGSDAPPAG